MHNFGTTMDTGKAGFIGMIITWMFNFLSNLAALEDHLKVISLILAIIVSLFTISWYIGNMFIRRKEFFRHVKEFIKSKKG